MSGATGCICPFCSINNVWIESRDDGNYLKCENCGATGPDECDSFYAMEAWNKPRTRIAELEQQLSKKPQATTMFKLGHREGMERAAEIGNNILPSKLGNPVHGYTCGYNDGWYRYQEAIRKEIELSLIHI